MVIFYNTKYSYVFILENACLNIATQKLIELLKE